MQQSILESFPKADIAIIIVWIEMLPGDTVAAAQTRAGVIRDPRVRHFYDPRSAHRAGQAFAKGLLNEGAGPAWDVYLFYDKEARWNDELPKPVDWMHQLGGVARADPRRLHVGDDLVTQLRRSMERMTGLKSASEGE